MKWDNEVGAVLLAKYPEDLEIDKKLFTTIYANHRIDNTEPNYATITLRDLKITSFYTGFGENVFILPNYVVAFLLSKDDRPFKFRETLKETTYKILQNLKDDNYKKLLPELHEMLNYV